MAARRSGSLVSKSRILREGVGSMRFQLELEARSLRSAEAAAQERQKQAEEGA